MIRRAIAAVLAILLAAIGIFLVLRYAQGADRRAMEGMETDSVFVAVEAISAGTLASELGDKVEAREVPRQFQVDGAIRSLEDLEGTLALADIPAGEQLQDDRWVTPEELRRRDAFEIPEEAQDLHQVTVPLGNARALGGNIAAGDHVGVFMSFEAEFQRGLYVDADGQVRWLEDLPSDFDSGESGGESNSLRLDLTKLAIEKVLVLRVQGGYVPDPVPASASADENAEEEEEAPGSRDEILVTLALTGSDAERLVYAMEFGQVWLSYQPEDSELDDDDVKVIQLPREAGDVLSE